MPKEVPIASGEDGRVSTGAPALDEILHGGLVARRPYLIVGPAGTGKTTLALQFLCEGARQGESCLVVTLEEPPNEMRYNHRALRPELDRVYVFDAIPDVMRYERAPFKDIAAVRHAVRFAEVPGDIRKTPELASVEVTFTALEQTLRMEMVRRPYSRLVIDSLTALQYFCMKGVDEIVGAQTFLRFLSDLRVTTLLTVESPLEDIETPERMLARGEVRLFRWEFDGKTVRALGVEKFRGSPHDVRIHPYRISSKGVDINLEETISRDSRQIVRPPTSVVPPQGAVGIPEEVTGAPSAFDSLGEELSDLIAAGAEVGEVRGEIERALAAARVNDLMAAERHLVRARGIVLEMVHDFRVEALESEANGPSTPSALAARRLRARAADGRAAIVPSPEPDLRKLTPALQRLLSQIPTSEVVAGAPPEPPAPPPRPVPLGRGALTRTSSPPQTTVASARPSPPVTAPRQSDARSTPPPERPKDVLSLQSPLPPPPPPGPSPTLSLKAADSVPRRAGSFRYPPPPLPARATATPTAASPPPSIPARTNRRVEVTVLRPTKSPRGTPVSTSAGPSTREAPRPGAALSPSEAQVQVPPTSSTSAKRRRRAPRSATGRKRSVEIPAAEEPSLSTSMPLGSKETATPLETDTSVRRRTPRKRRAPTVTAATPGPHPPPASTASSAPTDTATSDAEPRAGSG